MGPRRVALVFGALHVVSACLVVIGLAGLPARVAPVDAGAMLVVALDLAAGVALLAGLGSASRLARLSAWVTLALGLALGAAVALSAGWLWGVYGAVGRGGAIVFVLVEALVAPYLVVRPLLELVWIGPARRPSS